MSARNRSAFTLIELLVVVAIITLLMSLVLPGLKAARRAAQGVVCLSNQRQIGLAARMYMDHNRGEMFHHHEGWVLDDGTQVETLPASLAAVEGGGVGHSAAEKPWAIFFQPYLGSREVGFCPSDPTPRSRTLARSLEAFNGGITLTTQAPPEESELALAERDGLNLQSYLLNSVFSHKSARYAVEGALEAFLNDTRSLSIANRKIIMFSERN